MTEKIAKSPEEWKKELTLINTRFVSIMEQNHHFLGKYNNSKLEGSYKCTCCGEELFSSEAKFDSGSGWPSFWKPIDDEKIEFISDTSYGMVRTEVNCNKCGSHLGHVF